MCFPAGDYEVSVMFNEEHISESPFLVSVNAATDKSLTQGQRGDGMNWQFLKTISILHGIYLSV